MKDVSFLTPEIVIKLHSLQIMKFGGDSSLRDANLLDSACAMPVAVFGDEYLHADVFEMAAAYLYHITKNHPFVDGNKRTGLISAMVFLDINGYVVNSGDDELYRVALSVAEGSLGKPDVADFFRKWTEIKD
ncbi:type II toxin-antitoxin system death-on-curing family toxin [Seleniivibrio woodruffii]|uniref:type II toxin-antitoxin system death-on-curing family toxin n=1 Tax=Seleniivibrio woodruffii TaxID=1078050 RepID=UPI0026EDF781|nr:type II toxin-antitoxin system death-on-curing family toxin [Seleniivibrio woodruffii]